MRNTILPYKTMIVVLLTFFNLKRGISIGLLKLINYKFIMTKQRKLLPSRRFGNVLNYHKIGWTFALNFAIKKLMVWEAISKTHKTVSSQYQAPWSWLKKRTWLCLVFFSPFLGVWKLDETLFFVFDIPWTSYCGYLIWTSKQCSEEHINWGKFIFTCTSVL